MYRRIIECHVTDEYVRGAGVVVGAAGSGNDVAIRLLFNPMWDGTTKSIEWFNAYGENPTLTILTADLLEAGTTNVYVVPIPPEPKEYAGEMRMVLKGIQIDDNGITSATMSAVAEFTVMESEWDPDAQESADINPTQAEQLQQQVDRILDTVGKIPAYVEEAKESAEAAYASEIISAENAAVSTAAGEISGQNASAAAASAAEAKRWADQASETVGGDFATKIEVQEIVSAAEKRVKDDSAQKVKVHNEDKEAHPDIREAVDGARKVAESKATMEEVNAAIVAAVGVAIGGAY